MSNRIPCLARPAGHRQRGATALAFSLMFLPLLGCAAFAIDVANMYVARNELQNAADAAALAGAAQLTQGSGSTNWSQAQSAAVAAIGLNASGGIKLTNATALAGYWNLTGTPTRMQATNITPGPYDVPAIQVNVSRSTGNNGGPFPLLLGPLLGVASTTVSASAVAIVSGPGSVAAGSAFPMVIDKCVLDQYWNASTATPIIDPATGQPYEFQIGNSQTYGSQCTAGQWTSFLVNANDVPTMRDLMTSGNPTSLSVGNSIWLQPGAKTTLYSSVPTNVTVLLPVATGTTSNTYVPIVAFVAFHIDASVGGSGKYVQGHFVANYVLPAGSGGAGVAYGAYLPPRLGA